MPNKHFTTNETRRKLNFPNDYWLKNSHDNSYRFAGTSYLSHSINKNNIITALYIRYHSADLLQAENLPLPQCWLQTEHSCPQGWFLSLTTTCYSRALPTWLQKSLNNWGKSSSLPDWGMQRTNEPPRIQNALGTSSLGAVNKDRLLGEAAPWELQSKAAPDGLSSSSAFPEPSLSSSSQSCFPPARLSRYYKLRNLPKSM